MIIQFIVSLFATLSFAELFGAPKKELFFCGLTGAIGWVVYVIGLNSNMGTVLANLTATFALTVFSRILSAIRRNPVTSSPVFFRWFPEQVFTIHPTISS